MRETASNATDHLRGAVDDSARSTTKLASRRLYNSCNIGPTDGLTINHSSFPSCFLHNFCCCIRSAAHHKMLAYVLSREWNDRKGKGKGLDTCYSAAYMSQTRDQQRFTILEVAADWHEPIWCRSALCGHPLHALTDNWTHGAASRHIIAPISHTRPSRDGLDKQVPCLKTVKCNEISSYHYAIGSCKISCLCHLDLSAAFDTIYHNILLTHLSSWFGIHGTAQI